MWASSRSCRRPKRQAGQWTADLLSTTLASWEAFSSLALWFLQSEPVSALCRDSTRIRYGLFEPIVVQCRCNFVLSDEVCGSPLQPKRISLCEIAAKQCGDFIRVLLEIGVHPVHVDAGGLDGFAHLLRRYFRSRYIHQGLMGDVVLALIFCGQHKLSACDGRFGQNRPVLVDEANFAVGFHQPLEIWLRLLAERTIVVEEGDDRQVAFGIARDGSRRIVEDGVARGIGLVRAGGLRTYRGKERDRNKNPAQQHGRLRCRRGHGGHGHSPEWMISARGNWRVTSRGHSRSC